MLRSGFKSCYSTEKKKEQKQINFSGPCRCMCLLLQLTVASLHVLSSLLILGIPSVAKQAMRRIAFSKAAREPC
jgi:uncharacterized ferredoxin-like protein